MKKQFTLLLFCISILFISQNLYSQSGWVIQNTGSNQFLQSIYVVDSSYCYVTGDSGTFLKTTNGGLNWLSLNYEAMNDLMSVYFFDRNNGLMLNQCKEDMGESEWKSEEYYQSI